MGHKKFGIVLLLFLFFCGIFIAFFILKTKKIRVPFLSSQPSQVSIPSSNKGVAIQNLILAVSTKSSEEALSLLSKKYLREQGEVPLKSNISYLKDASLIMREPFYASPWNKTTEFYRSQIELPTIIKMASLSARPGLMNWQKGLNNIVYSVVYEDKQWKIDSILLFQ